VRVAAPSGKTNEAREDRLLTTGEHTFNGAYSGDHLARTAFPLGGIGAGMVCLEGAGALSHVSVRHRPQVFHEPLIFAALCVKGDEAVARVLEGPVPKWKVFYPWPTRHTGAGNGGGGKSYGLPRFRHAEFRARFPFATVRLSDADVPLDAAIEAWSPFTPGDEDCSSLPVAGLEYAFTNPTDQTVEGVFSFHARNFMATGSGGDAVLPVRGGFVLWQAGSRDRQHDRGAFSVTADDPQARANCAWFRGSWFDPLSIVWKSVASGEVIQAGPPDEGSPSPGGSVYVPFSLDPGAEKTIVVRLAWHVPRSDLRVGADPQEVEACCGASTCAGSVATAGCYVPWYAGQFPDIGALDAHWCERYGSLRQRSKQFSDCFFDTTLPAEVVEAVAANLTILKSPTVLRQADGRLWAWEGCCDEEGCCHGSCTHVWNYAQAVAHLFPALERSLRQTEFGENQDERGHQDFRASLPIRPTAHSFHSASDGQLGGIMKVYRDWRISGDTEWLRCLWPRVEQSLDYCIETWDPDHTGALVEPHHNTYDIEFWGPDGMCSSFYIGALQAAAEMGRALGSDVSFYKRLMEDGRRYLEEDLFNGEYFVQHIQWKDLRAGDPAEEARNALRVNYSPEALTLLEQEGPKYQYGQGCLSDGILGAWIAAVCGLDPIVDQAKVVSHLVAVYRYNFHGDLHAHANPQRPTYAVGDEAGLTLCSWPHGGRLSLPFPYSDEIWTGIEYQVASHLMMCGRVGEGLEIVRAVRDRYDGRARNPFNEYECGHWYARALASYGLLQGTTGVRYDAVGSVLTIRPSIRGDFRVFLCTATGYGTVGVRDGEPFVEVCSGAIPYTRIDYTPCS
jgi:uncharacterized protein (DUF608 family)